MYTVKFISSHLINRVELNVQICSETLEALNDLHEERNRQINESTDKLNQSFNSKLQEFNVQCTNSNRLLRALNDDRSD